MYNRATGSKAFIFTNQLTSCASRVVGIGGAYFCCSFPQIELSVTITSIHRGCLVRCKYLCCKPLATWLASPQSSFLQLPRIPRLMELSIKKPRFTNSRTFCHTLHGCIFWKIAVECVFFIPLCPLFCSTFISISTKSLRSSYLMSHCWPLSLANLQGGVRGSLSQKCRLKTAPQSPPPHC